jgi:hypothetical protein
MPRVLIHTNLKDGDIPDDFDDKELIGGQILKIYYCYYRI